MQTLKYVTELKNETEITSGSVEDTAHMRRALEHCLRFTWYPLDVARGEREREREKKRANENDR